MSLHYYTLADLKTAMKHAIGGNPDANADLTQIANDALSWLCDYHPWTWLRRALSLDFTSSQNYIALPTDFKAIHSAVRYSTMGSLIPVTLEDIQNLRARAIIAASSIDLYYALSMTGQASVTALPVYRMEIYPTPSAGATGAIIGTYLHLTPKLTSDSDVPEIPAPWHVALKHVCRGMAFSFQQRDDVIDWAQAKTILDALVINDGMAQPSLGRMKGAVSRYRNDDGPNFVRGTIVSP